MNVNTTQPERFREFAVSLEGEFSELAFRAALERIIRIKRPHEGTDEPNAGEVDQDEAQRLAGIEPSQAEFSAGRSS